MSMIEGIGDEVTQFVIVLIVLLVVAAAWWSTGSRPNRFRTVLVMGVRRTAHRSLAVAYPTTTADEALPVLNNPNSIETTGTNQNTTEASSNAINNIDSDTSDLTTVIEDESRASNVETEPSRPNDSQYSFVTPGQSCTQCVNGEVCNKNDCPSSEREMERIVHAMDNMEVNLRRRLNCGEKSNSADEVVLNQDQDTCLNIETPPSRGEERPQITSPRNLQKLIEETGDNSVQNESSIGTGKQNDTNKSQPIIEDIEDKIIIKIKYLNDAMKIVEASKSETLYDFKWRNFESELSSSNVRLRLIFKGRVLTEDDCSLSECGLYSDCVIHCLVHPQRQIRPNEELQLRNNYDQELRDISRLRAAAGDRWVHVGMGRDGLPNGTPGRVWDFENVFMSLISIALTILWFCRCEYSNLFSVSASVALFGLTIFYSIAVFGLYLSDMFQSRQRAPPH